MRYSRRKDTVSLPPVIHSSNASKILLLVVAVDDSRLVDVLLVVRDSTKQIVW